MYILKIVQEVKKIVSHNSEGIKKGVSMGEKGICWLKIINYCWNDLSRGSMTFCWGGMGTSELRQAVYIFSDIQFLVTKASKFLFT